MTVARRGRLFSVLLVLLCEQTAGSDRLWRPSFHFFFSDPTNGVGFHSNDATGSFYDEQTGTWHAFYDCTPPAWYASGLRKGAYSW